MSTKVYTILEVAKILRIGKNGAYALVNSGMLKALRLNGLKVTENELERFLQENLDVEINTEEL